MPVDDPKTCVEITRLQDSVTSLNTKFDAFAISFHSHAVNEAKFEKEMEKIFHAFPDGVENHRAAHQAMIDAAKAQENFYNTLRQDIIKWGILGFLTVVCGLIILGIKAHVMGWIGGK